MKGFAASSAYVSAAHELIPGGAHTYAKGDDQYPEESPVIDRGAGAMSGTSTATSSSSTAAGSDRSCSATGSRRW